MPEGCVFVLAVHRDSKSLEFAYPPQLKGNVIPVDHKSIAGRAVISKRSYITNNFRDERGFVLFDWLMSKGNAKIQKMITYPVIVLDKVIAVLHITRRGGTFSEAGPDFHNGDVEKIQSMLDDSLNLHVVNSA